MRDQGQRFREAALTSVSAFEPPRGVESMLALWHINRVARHVEYRFEFEVHQPLGWNWTAFRIMVNLSLLGPMEPSRLAEVLELSRPTVSNALKPLEAKGFILSETSPESKKHKLISLTREGKKAAERGRPGQREIEVAVLQALSDEELSTLNQLLQKVYDSMP